MFSLAASLAVAALFPAHLCADSSVAHFKDPNAPGRFVVQIGTGDVEIVGADTKDVSIDSTTNPKKNDDRPDGLRRLDSDDGYQLSTSDDGNVITLTLDSIMTHGSGGDVKVTLPRQTSVLVERSMPGDTKISNLSGDLEIRGVAGDIVLDQVSGGVLIESAAGDVNASFAALPQQKPIAIQVVNGDVALRVPEQAKANVKFRTLRGEVLTDFSEQQLQTRSEGSGGGEMQDAMADEASMAAEKAARDAERAARDAERAERDRTRNKTQRQSGDANVTVETGPNPAPTVSVKPSVTVKMPKPPRIPMPPTGGRLVAGALNGGGVDLSVTTINGTITFRKAAAP